MKMRGESLARHAGETYLIAFLDPSSLSDMNLLQMGVFCDIAVAMVYGNDISGALLRPCHRYPRAVGHGVDRCAGGDDESESVMLRLPLVERIDLIAGGRPHLREDEVLYRKHQRRHGIPHLNAPLHYIVKGPVDPAGGISGLGKL